MTKSPSVTILADFEGVSQVKRWWDVFDWSPGFDQARRALTDDLNAVVRGMKAGGAGDITIIDGHTWGEQNNVIEDGLESGVRLIQGPELNRVHLYDWKSDAVALVGRHAMAGTKNGFMSHTINLELGVGLRINGQANGEIGFWGLWAAHQKIPLILLTGDTAASREAGRLDGVHAISVKEGVTRTSCKCYPKDLVVKRLEQAGRTAMNNLKSVKPLHLPKAFVTEVSFASPQLAKSALVIPGSKSVRPNVIRYTASNYMDCRRFVNAAIALANSQNIGSLLLRLRKNRANSVEITKWIREQYRQALLRTRP